MSAHPQQAADHSLSLGGELAGKLAKFGEDVARYRAGAMSADEFKPCRLQWGIYGIRGLKDRQMIRVKVPAGRLDAAQFDALADAAERFATGRAHFTTRQDVQIYEVPVERVPELLAALSGAGLTTREACGNSVRNVTACPFAGLCPDELFDVTPYALAVTRHFLGNPVSQALPRKFKTSFSGCAHDRAMSIIHDIGVVATAREGDGALGFRLFVGGGLGAIPRPADLLEPFTPVGALLPSFEAIITIFDQHGERKNRQRARMKFLLERIGIDEFRRLVFEERERLLRAPERFAALPAPVPAGPASPAQSIASMGGSNAYARWLNTNVQPQRQAGYAMVTVRLLLGDLTAAQMRELSQVARRYSRAQLVATQWQDICLPWVGLERLPKLFEALTSIGLALPEAERVQDITACPGADTCQIGITSSRGLASVLTELLETPDYQRDDLRDVRIKISGCPNSCGLHHVADIGLHGASRSVEGKAMPYYQLLVGGGAIRNGEGASPFGKPVVRLPAKHVPQAVTQLLDCFRRERRDGENFQAFVRRVGVAPLQALLQPLTAVRPHGEDPDTYRDWGKPHDFSLAGMGQGECAG